MAKPGDVLRAPQLGVRVEFRRTAAETGGEAGVPRRREPFAADSDDTAPHLRDGARKLHQME